MDDMPRSLRHAALRRLALADRGVEIALLDFGGDGPLALLHHANGFCKGTWALVAEGLRERFHVVAMDARGHGDSSHPEGRAAYAWREFAADLASVARVLVRERDGAPVALAIGHSFGGTSLLGASARHPELFERALLVDPVTPPPRTEGAVTPERKAHVDELVERARSRRAEWPSRAEARAWFAERSLFADWLPEALDLYVRDGLRERADGSVVLKCPGEVEGAVFSGGDQVDVPALARDNPVPALFLWAERGSFPRPLYEALAASMVHARVETVASGHLIPMERPELVVEQALRFVDEPPPGTRAPRVSRSAP